MGGGSGLWRLDSSEDSADAHSLIKGAAMLKILYIGEDASAYKNKGRAYDVELIKELKKSVRLVVYTRDRDVSKMTIKDHDDIRYYIVHPTKRKIRFHLLDSIIKKLTGIRKLLSDCSDIRKILRSEKPDIIQAEGVIPYGLIAYLASKTALFEPKIIVSAHLVDGLRIPFEYLDRQKGKIVDFLSSVVLSNCHIRANSFLTKEWLMKSGGIGKKIEVIVPNIDSDFFPSGRQIKTERHCPARFIAVSRYTPMKALDILFSSFELVLRQLPDAILHIYGQDRNISGIGDYRTYLQKLIDTKKLGNNINLFHEINHSDVPNKIEEYDFNICSSHGETLNLVVVEACTVGVPSIVTEYCGISTWVRKYKTGIITKCNAKSLSESLLQAAKMDSNEYKKMSENCYDLIKEFFPSCVASQLLDFYHQVLLDGYEKNTTC